MGRREHWIAQAPQRLAVLTGRPVLLGVADQLDGQSIDREGGAVELQEALLDRDAVAGAAQAGEDGIGDQRAPSPAAPVVERAGDLLTPGEGAEIVTSLLGGGEEADRQVKIQDRLGPTPLLVSLPLTPISTAR